VTVRRILAFLVALALGAGVALLAACGEGTSAGVPAANASDLKSQIEDVQQAVDDGRCTDVAGQLKQVDEGIDDLPPSVDSQLVNALNEGATKLRGLAIEECGVAETETTDTTTTETTETLTETAPPLETTTEPPTTTPAPTTTIPTPTTPTPPPEPAPVPPPPPPSGTPGGGVEPEIP
jgi:hypothetical protein